jgi:hypothetical protein
LICAHIAAALVKVRQFLAQRAEEKKLKQVHSEHTEQNRLTVQSALEHATPEALESFVRNYAKRDRDFALALKTWFASSITATENPYALVLAAVFPKKKLGKNAARTRFPPHLQNTGRPGNPTNGSSNPAKSSDQFPVGVHDP